MAVEPARKKAGKGKAFSSTLTTLQFKQRNLCDAFLPQAFHELDFASVMRIPAEAHSRRDQDGVGEVYQLVVKDEDSRFMSSNLALMLARMTTVFHSDTAPETLIPGGATEAGAALAGLEKNTIVHGKVSYAVSKSMYVPLQVEQMSTHTFSVDSSCKPACGGTQAVIGPALFCPACSTAMTILFRRSRWWQCILLAQQSPVWCPLRTRLGLLWLAQPLRQVEERQLWAQALVVAHLLLSCRRGQLLRPHPGTTSTATPSP